MGKRRILTALVATAVLTTGTVAVGSPSVWANDLVNGDFATGDGSGWNIYGGAFAVESGFGCLSIAAGTGPYGAAFQQRVRLEPETDYVLSFDAKVPTGAATSVTVVVQLPRDPYTGYLTPQAIAAQLGPDPTSFEYTFTTPADLPPADVGGDPDGPNASLEFQHTASGADGYQLCLTNVDLHAAGAEQVVNGGFDDGTAGWTSMYPNASVIDGWGCVDVPAGTGAYGAGIGQLVSLEPDTDYSLTFTAKLLAGSGTPGPIRAVVQLPRDPFTQYLPEKAIASELSTEPAEFEFSFTTPSTLPPASEGGDPAGPHAELTIQQNGPTVAAYVLCVDDVSLIGGVAPEPYEPDTGPSVRVNHVGYFQHGPKHATLVSAAVEPVAWELLDGSGTIVASGSTTPAGFDDAAGLDVHTIDFSDYTGVGDGYTLRADGEQSFPFEIGVADVYEQMRYDALDYYYPARSGIEIDGSIAGAGYARPAGHVSSPADGAANKGDLDVPCQSLDNQTGPSGDNYYGSLWTCPAGYTLDVVGGWYDAGDHGKYVVNGGIAVAQLMGTYERTKTAPTGDPANLADGTLAVPESDNGVPDVLDEARWELEWMMSMQVPPRSGRQLIDGNTVDVSGMVHHKIHDEGWTGLPLLPSADSQVRSLHRPSTAATLNFAAVAAQGARLWAPYDPGFAAELLSAGTTAYRAAKANPSILATAADGAEGGGPYNDSNVSDEFYWAAAELFLTTGERAYRNDVLGVAAEHGRRLSRRRVLVGLHGIAGSHRSRHRPQRPPRPGVDPAVGDHRRRRVAGDPGRRAVRAPVRRRRRRQLRVGIQQPGAQQPRRARGGVRSHRRRRISRRRDARDGLPARSQLARVVVPHRVRRAHSQLGQPAQPLVGSAARHDAAAPTRRGDLGWTQLAQRHLGPGRPITLPRSGMCTPALLRRRHPVVVDQRAHRQLERADGVGRQLPRRPGRRGGGRGRSVCGRLRLGSDLQPLPADTRVVHVAGHDDTARRHADVVVLGGAEGRSRDPSGRRSGRRARHGAVVVPDQCRGAWPDRVVRDVRRPKGVGELRPGTIPTRRPQLLDTLTAITTDAPAANGRRRSRARTRRARTPDRPVRRSLRRGVHRSRAGPG